MAILKDQCKGVENRSNEKEIYIVDRSRGYSHVSSFNKMAISKSRCKSIRNRSNEKYM